MTEIALRTDADAAGEALATLLPDAALRRSVAEVVAASIRLAHAQAPASWELTAWTDFMRLNVGQIAVLEVSPNEVFVYTVAGPPPKNRAYRMEDHNYRAVSVSTERWSVSLAAAAGLEPELRERHRALIQVAAQAKRVSPFRRAHSPGTVAAIAKLTGGVLLQPEYVDDSALGPEEGDGDEGGAAGALFGSPDANLEVERAAVDLATTRLTAEGWRVHSVERDRCGYDLHCERRGKELHVEVKGVRGEPTRFVITAGEVRRAAGDRSFALILVGRALSAEPTFERWSGPDLLRAFALEPLQYVARRGAA